MTTNKATWQGSLHRLLNRKARTIPNYSYNVVNRRMDGVMGGETEHSGFRAGIFYFKLSTLVDLEVMHNVIDEIARKMGPSAQHQFATLFLNDPNNNLLYPKSMVKSKNVVRRILNDYYAEYADEYEDFSGVMEQVFPPIDFYSPKRYPENKDICVIFTDRYGIELAPAVLPKAKRLQDNFLIIQVDRHRPVDIVELSRVI